MRTRPLLLLTCLATFAACDDTVGVEDIRVPLEPKGIYPMVWGEMMACSDRTRLFTGVRWFQAPYFPGHPDLLGQWNSRREITLRSDVLFDQEVVAHEILHDLLRGDALHEDPAWDACDVLKGSDVVG